MQSATTFSIGDRVVAKNGEGRLMEVLGVRPAGADKFAVYCAWWTPGYGRVTRRFLASQLAKAPRLGKAFHDRLVRRNAPVGHARELR
ncbi:hypothetical protein [Phreatobacter stygius]|uniref:DUF2158 domain-containing protein n=1 Tax=Phreatobacter stygius TaxID=1940610 RepID=A0A4D7B2D8_9HYPH|nr:hypothetical protein [Phreatobacter stygius]QCI67001.1 hypothetical protein E8M01_23795 [Phreatobacter stygius]